MLSFVPLTLNFLAVRQHQANSHAKKGWEQFTDAVIETISKKKKGVVFLLWGNYAQVKSRYILIGYSKFGLWKEYSLMKTHATSSPPTFICSSFELETQLVKLL